MADPGYIADVSSGNPIDPDTWGNPIRNRVIHHFADSTARDAAITSPTEGTAAFLNDVDQLTIYNGAAWKIAASIGAWTSWTPSWTNVTVGNGTVVAKYQRVGQTVRFSLTFTLGSTSSVSGLLIFTLPVSAAADRDQVAFGMLQDASAGPKKYAIIDRISGTSADLPVEASTAGNVGATTPFTWATGDIFRVQGEYETA